MNSTYYEKITTKRYLCRIRIGEGDIMTFEEKVYNEMIRVCFSNSKKRKKFQRVFKSWDLEERRNFLRGLDIYVSTPISIKVYYVKRNNTLKVSVLTPDYRSKDIVGITRDYIGNGRFGDVVFANIVSWKTPLI